MGKKNDEIAKMVENLQGGNDSGLESKTDTFNMRISPKLKADLYLRAKDAGMTLSEYMGIIIGEIERERNATKMLGKAQNLCADLETENEQLKSQLANQKAETEAILAPLEAIYSKVKSKNLQKFKGKDISTLPKFVKELSNLIIV